jgi:cytidine deaminase
MSISPDKYALSEATLQLLAEQDNSQSFSGMLERAIVDKMLELEGKPVEDFLVGLLPRAATRAFVPISNYYVGVALLGRSGNIYFGSNIEIPGQSLGCSVHGEQSAISNAFSHGESEIKIIAVTAAPCGHCRQFMTEFSLSMDMSVIIKDTAEMTVGKLLPEHFGPAHLGNTHGALQSKRNGLKMLEAVSNSQLEQLAFDAADKSYAPYSNSPSGAAVLLKSGRAFAGSYIESVAYNPSLPPLQAALVALIQSGEKPTDIVDCVLAELKDAKITQKDSAGAVLKGLAGDVSLDLVQLCV